MFKTKLAYENWNSKYRYKDESPIETQIRAAKALASVESPEEREMWGEKFLNTLVKFDEDGNPTGLKATLGGRVTANIGTEYKATTLMNCFSGGEKLITKEYGVVSFNDVAGKNVHILNENGWELATIKSFGTQGLNRVTFAPAYKQKPNFENQTGDVYVCKKGQYAKSVEVTKNHRWVLADGTETTDIKVGDVVPAQKNAYDVNTDDYINGFRHGFVFGDGSLNYVYSNGDYKFELRLFGEKDMKHSHMFEDVRVSPWEGVDAVAYIRTEEDLKKLPVRCKSPNYIAGFIFGWLAADGCILDDNRVELCSVQADALNWARDNAPLAGMIATGYRVDYHSPETNLGARKNFTKRLILSVADNLYYKVISIENMLKEETVYCAVVPTTHMFTLAGGIYTSNCFINGPVKNAQIFYTREVPGTDKHIINNILTQSTPDSLANIFLTILEQAETLKSEGGYGINFDFIRPRGSIIKGIGIQHPGVVKYMEIWDKVSEIIVQGNNDGYKDVLRNYLNDAQIKALDKPMKKMARKGAMMGCLSVWHPDIEEFVRAKQVPGRLTKFNISVVVDDKFMQAVEADEYYDLHFNGVVYKRIKARELYDLIMQSTYNRAEPGVLFYDNMQRNNPISYLGEVNATNPCGEIPGNPVTSTVCLLGSINLTQYVKKDRTFDWEQYIEDVRIFARMLDNVNDLTDTALPQYRWATKNIRQYGMGINGLGSTLFMLGIPYNSKEAIEFTHNVNWIKEDLSWETSALLAKEKGVFPAYNEKFVETNWFKNFTLISPETKELIKKYGVRNAKTTTNAPLGNSSVICDMVSNGIEPVFDFGYRRTYIADGWPEGLTVENVKEILQETKQGDAIVWQGEFNGVFYHYEPHNRGLCIVEDVWDYGYKWVMENYPEDIENEAQYLVTTNKLKVEDHVAIQAVVQRNINQSVSKTANLPNDYPFEDFKGLYINAWKKGLIGFTTYRDGSMEAVLSKIDAKEEKKEVAVITEGLVLPDEFLNGPTKVITREGMKFYINFSYFPEDSEMQHPVAMWIHTNQKGETVAANQSAKKLADLLRQFGIDETLIERQLEKIKGNPSHQKVSKMVSMCLRHNLPIASIVMALENIDEDYISSLLTAVRKFLGAVIKDGTAIPGRQCSVCESTDLVFESGCSKCRSCGSSNCG